MIKKQHEDVMQLLETQVTWSQHRDLKIGPFLYTTQRASNFTNFHEMTKEFQKTLRHDDFTITTDLCTSVMWMETMMGSLIHLQNSKRRFIHSAGLGYIHYACMRFVYLTESSTFISSWQKLWQN